jgi:hypothetical protein
LPLAAKRAEPLRRKQLDRKRNHRENGDMATTDAQDSGIPREIIADLEEVCRQAASGGVPDPELLQRVRERSARVQEELRQKYGEMNVALDLLREIRDEE